MISHQLSLDAADIRIASHLQTNARASNAELAETVHLSPSQCHRRVKRLEELGVIAGYRAELDRHALGLGIFAFVQVSLATHAKNPTKAFEDAIADFPQILECYSLTGDTDYLMRVAFPDLDAFSEFLMERIITLPMVGSVKSSIVLDEVRRGSGLPLHHLTP
ncbi:MAG: Lrp/AsnC family transcriptional regulator [Rhodospirillales bacterium]|jgi:Lrp/AsnC family leucine-responsive transcriptional regulator|nr:Lrp/AsnC family transcriptional regulator [Rhodospirillales bacterium]MDP6645437.1 Lrp/AsnC family transcriptional regulator [Rhodospirillales bacterium]MDP6841695.1 Lrp/AsnC family transcriptional regulator [Rhodospirillales bacterium]|tara:strand:+ start:868 stop:1356 length:489 start_codon:yes stop_codon:yes gene_type:complete